MIELLEQQKKLTSNQWKLNDCAGPPRPVESLKQNRAGDSKRRPDVTTAECPLTRPVLFLITNFINR